MAVMLGLAVLQAPTPASAGGSFTFMITPHGKNADLVSTGLQIYALTQQAKSKKKNQAILKQNGVNNAAAIGQKGKGNLAFVSQKGKNHTATVDQAGWNNTLGVFQFGKNTDLDIGQAGNGQVGLVFQGGW
jgi:hypothetical protein